MSQRTSMSVEDSTSTARVQHEYKGRKTVSTVTRIELSHPYSDPDPDPDSDPA
jgi:hypothetical protein